MYFDTHCHLSMFKDIPSIISKAKARSVKYILAVSMYYRDNWNILNLAKQYSEIIPALGVHPIETPNLSNLEEQLITIDKLILENDVPVIGEIGLDHYFVKNDHLWPQQETVFKHFLELALNHNLPVNLHGKYAEKELFDVLSEYDLKIVVVHWFAGSPELIKEGIDRAYYFSVTPEVFYSERMQQLVKLVPIEQLLSESDGPVTYKKPRQFLGEPALMEDVVREIAQIKEQNQQEVARVLFNTATKLFLKQA